MSTKHTPGPWVDWSDNNMNGKGHAITGTTAAMSMIARHAIDEAMNRASWSGSYFVVAAKELQSPALAFGADTTEAEANARLIAAAPDLLAMLKDCRDYLSCIPESAAGGDDMAVTLTRACDAAIKQATGADE